MGKHRFVLVVILVLNLTLQTVAQRWNITHRNNEPIAFSASQIIVTKDTFYISANDSAIVLPKGTKYRIKKNPLTKSEVFYDSLRVKSYRHRITQEIYHLLVKTSTLEVHDTSNFNKSENVFIKYQGLTIRNIRLKQIDVIEGSIYDTSVTAYSFLGKRANNVHTNTVKRKIYNNLTFKEGDKIDADQMADNERVLRAMPYIEDARIHVIPDANDKTIADILILTKDEFSFGIGIDIREYNNFKLLVSDKNFLGLGHKMEHALIYHSGEEPEYGYGFQYAVNNISNSFISSRFVYENSWDKELTMINANKAFLTPQTKYAGGLSIYELADKREYAGSDFEYEIPFRVVINDFWLARAFPLQGFNRTRINTALRYTNTYFKQRPFVSQDSNFFYRNANMWLAELSLTKRNYYKSSLVLGFGVTEDIPYGYVVNIRGGIEKNEFGQRPYFGGGITVAKHFKIPGYLMADLSFGSFYNNGKLQDAVFKFELLNVGNLHHINRYSIRNFCTLKFQYGYNFSDPDTKTQLNNRWTTIVTGLEKEKLKGTQKVSINAESALFTPWYVFGFKFSSFVFANTGWISDNTTIGKGYSLFSSLGGGIRIKNESWIFETITLGFAWFAKAPEGSDRMGFVFDASDPRLFNNLHPDKPKIVRMDHSPSIFID